MWNVPRKSFQSVFYFFDFQNIICNNFMTASTCSPIISSPNPGFFVTCFLTPVSLCQGFCISGNFFPKHQNHQPSILPILSKTLEQGGGSNLVIFTFCRLRHEKSKFSKFQQINLTVWNSMEKFKYSKLRPCFMSSLLSKKNIFGYIFFFDTLFFVKNCILKNTGFETVSGPVSILQFDQRTPVPCIRT